jgi:hypothetical protein
VNWIESLRGDPRRDLVQCVEPFTIFRTLVDLLEMPEDSPIVESVRERVIEDTKVEHLAQSLPIDWPNYLVKGHDKADYPPSVLLLLQDLGVRINDFPKIQPLLSQMKSHQDDDGRFLSLARFPGKPPMTGSSLCDTHIITEALIRFGYDKTSEVEKALDRIHQDLKETNQGLAWKCEPNSTSGARGPGRKDDLCPQATLEALRVFSFFPESKRPKELIAAGETFLECWQRRKSERPYLFGHGTKFKKLRPPFFWYNIGEVLDVVSRYPDLKGHQSFREMLTILISAADEYGRFTPESTYRHFKEWSFGNKNEWSPWLTLYVCRILKRVFS